MKKTIILLLALFSLNVFAVTNTYTRLLTFPGMCENGTRIGNHRVNCIQWLKIDDERKTGSIMLTDIPYMVTSYEITDAGIKLVFDIFGVPQNRVFTFDKDKNLIGESGSIWYLGRRN